MVIMVIIFHALMVRTIVFKDTIVHEYCCDYYVLQNIQICMIMNISS